MDSYMWHHRDEVSMRVTYLARHYHTAYATSWSIPRLHATSARSVCNHLWEYNIHPCWMEACTPCCSNIIVKCSQTGVDAKADGNFARGDQSYSLMKAISPWHKWQRWFRQGEAPSTTVPLATWHAGKIGKFSQRCGKKSYRSSWQTWLPCFWCIWLHQHNHQ